MTPAELKRLIDLIALEAKPLGDALQIVGVSAQEVPGKVISVISSIANSAKTNPRALEALEALAEKHLPALQELTSIAKSGGRMATDAFEAIQRVGRGSPERIIEQLQALVRAGRGSASAAFEALVTLAEQGNIAAKNAVVEISKQASQYGQYAKEALSLVAKHGWQVVTAAATATQAGALGVMAGISTATLFAIGGAIVLVGLGIGYFWSRGDTPVLPGARMTGQQCPPIIRVERKCPWTPVGYTVNACPPFFCWDGGPQGALACKQEQSVPNSGRNYTTDLVCNSGYEAVRDPCTNVIIRCDRK